MEQEVVVDFARRQVAYSLEISTVSIGSPSGPNTSDSTVRASLMIPMEPSVMECMANTVYAVQSASHRQI